MDIVMDFDGMEEISTHKMRLKDVLELKQKHSMKSKVMLVLETIDFSCFHFLFQLLKLQILIC